MMANSSPFTFTSKYEPFYFVIPHNGNRCILDTLEFIKNKIPLWQLDLFFY